MTCIHSEDAKPIHRTALVSDGSDSQYNTTVIMHKRYVRAFMFPKVQNVRVCILFTFGLLASLQSSWPKDLTNKPDLIQLSRHLAAVKVLYTHTSPDKKAMTTWLCQPWQQIENHSACISQKKPSTCMNTLALRLWKHGRRVVTAGCSVRAWPSLWSALPHTGTTPSGLEAGAGPADLHSEGSG